MAARTLACLLSKNLDGQLARLTFGAQLSHSVTATSKRLPLVQKTHFSALGSANSLSDPNTLAKSVITPNGSFMAKRFKKKKSKASAVDEGKEDESDSDEEFEENPMLVEDYEQNVEEGAQLTTVEVSSLRLDAAAKAMFAVPRAKIEEAFYRGDLYVNGQRPSKKSQDLSVNDELDLVIRTNPEDHTKLDVKRVQIVSVPSHSGEHGKMKIEIRKWQHLTVAMYPDRKA